MPKRTSLSAMVDRAELAPQTDAEPATPAPAPAPKPAPVRRAPAAAAVLPARQAKASAEGASRYAGQVHIGASYDETDDTVNAFRELGFRKRRKTKDLLHEAMQLIVAKYPTFP